MSTDTFAADLRVHDAAVALAIAHRDAFLVRHAELSAHNSPLNEPPTVAPPMAQEVRRFDFSRLDPNWKAGRTQLTKSGRIALCVGILSKLDRHHLAKLFGISPGSVRTYELRVEKGAAATWPRGENLWAEVLAACSENGVTVD